MAYLDQVKPGAIKGWLNHKILPSLIGAQAALESGWGTSKLAKPPYNNNFGIKASNDWNGKTVTMPTREWSGGGWITVNAPFRAYDSLADSIEDHAKFFTNTPWRRENYKAVVGEKDYKKACWAVSKAGYATDPGYANKLIKLIQDYKLYEWDKEAFNGGGGTSTPVNDNSSSSESRLVDIQPSSKEVGSELSSAGKYEVTKYNVTLIGDKNLDAISSKIKNLIPNAKIATSSSFSMSWASSQVDNHQSDIYVIVLGNFMQPSRSEIASLVAKVDPKKIIFINVSSFYLMAQEFGVASKKYTNAFNGNFGSFANAHEGEYFDSTDYQNNNLTSAGQTALSKFIAQAIYEANTGDFTTRKAKTQKAEYYDIKDLELDRKGTIKFKAKNSDGSITTVTKETGIIGMYSPLGDPNIYNPKANEIWGISNRDSQSGWIEASFEDNDLSGAQLLEAGLKELVSRAEPSAQYTVSLLDIDDTLSIGDTGVFIDHEFTPPLYIQARVLEMTTSTTDPNLNTVTIGNVIELFPQAKPQLEILRDELIASREELYRDWLEGEPLKIEIDPLNGLVLSRGESDASTTLVAHVYQGNIEVTEHFSKFVWSRSSTDINADTVFNNDLKLETRPGLTVYPQDIIDVQSQFSVTVYDDTDRPLASQSVTVKASSKGADGEPGPPGPQGSKGETGPKGEKGDSSYTYQAYADSADGSVGFTLTESLDKAYTGFYTGPKSTAPTDYREYKWIKTGAQYADELRKEAEATNTATQEYLNNLQGELDKTKQAQEAFASKQTVSDFLKAYEAFKDAQIEDRAKAENDLKESISRLVAVENNLGDMAEKWKFLDTEIQMSENGLQIGNPSKGTYLLQQDDRISFFNNGSEVAFISGGMLQITQAVFVEQIQIGEYMLGAHDDDSSILVIRHVGGGLFGN